MSLARAEKFLLFLTILFLPTQLGRHFWPDFSLIYSLRIDYLSPAIYFWDLVLLILATVFLLQRKKINAIALNLYLFFILTQLISILYNDFTSEKFSLGASLVRVGQYTFAGFFGVYLASLNLEKIKKILFWALGISILGESLLAIGQFLKSETLGFWILGERSFSITTPAIAKFDFYGSQFLRPYATFPHPNVLAAYLVLSMILLFFFSQKQKRGISLAFIILGIISLILTVSRVAIVATFFSAFLLIQKKWFFLIILLIITVSPFLYPRFSSVLNFDNLTLLRREELSELALRMWFASPIFGVGLNNFIIATSENLVIGPSRFLQPVHNIILLTLAETGMIGMVGMVGMIGYPLLSLIRQAAGSGRKQLLLIWGVIIFLGMFDHYFLTLPQGYRLLFLVWGLSLSLVWSKIYK